MFGLGHLNNFWNSRALIHASYKWQLTNWPIIGDYCSLIIFESTKSGKANGDIPKMCNLLTNRLPTTTSFSAQNKQVFHSINLARPKGTIKTVLKTFDFASTWLVSICPTCIYYSTWWCRPWKHTVLPLCHVFFNLIQEHAWLHNRTFLGGNHVSGRNP